MTSRTMMGRLLILGPCTIWAAWLIWGGILGFPDAGDHTAMVAAVSANAGVTKWLLGLAALGMFLMVAGLQGLRNSMPGGQGSDYVAMGVLITTLSAAFGLGEIALTIVAGDVGAAGNVPTAMTIYLAGNGIGSLSTAGIFLGFTVIGLGVYIEKNHNTIIAILLLVSGLFGLGLSLYDYGSQLIGIAYLAMILSVISIGSSILRSSD